MPSASCTGQSGAGAARRLFFPLPQARSKQIDLGFEGEAACRGGEPLLLAELCANLLDNALKYTPRRAW